MKMYTLLLTISLLHPLIFCDEVKVETPDTIYLPYSESEDVDFAIARPSKIGCYQWTCEDEEVIELIPVHSNYDLLCGTKLEIKILPKSANPKGPHKIKVVAENLDVTEGPQMVEYNIVVSPVKRIEIMADKTQLKVDSDPVMFAAAAYDADDNEFDSLDGVRLSWFVGAQRDIMSFHGTQSGPVVSLEPRAGGRGAVILVIGDKFYEEMEPATLDFTITSQLELEPDGVYLLSGGEANLTLYEKLGGELVTLPWEVTSHTVTTREEDIARVDMKRKVVIGGEPDDETSLLVKDGEGNIIKGVPIRTARPHKMEIRSHPYPESRQLIVDQEYNITTTIWDNEGHEIYPSENILMKTTFGKQFDVLDITVNGLLARVLPEYVGVAKIRASLRATLTPDDEETEMEPHVKVTSDFEIYESVAMHPRKTILPFDPSVTPNYTLSYKVTGGGKVYGYEVSPDTMATVDSEGKVKVVAGPGTVTVTAGMSSSMHNNDTAKVILAVPSRLELPGYSVEWVVNQTVTVPLAFYTLDPDTEEEVMYTDCADVPVEVTLSNNKDFTLLPQPKRGDHHPPGSCGEVNIIGLVPGSSTKVTVSYIIPGTSTTLKESTTIAAYKPVESVIPAVKHNNQPPTVVLPVGSSKDVLLVDGHFAWPGKPSNFYKEVNVLVTEDNAVEDEPPTPAVVAARLIDTVEAPHTGLVVTCLRLGEAKVEVILGNKPSSTNKKPSASRKVIEVFCSEPAKISKVEIINLNVNMIQIKSPIVNKRTGRIMTYSYRDFNLVTTVKDKEGRTFDNTSSLQFRVALSDPKMGLNGGSLKYPFTFQSGVSSDFKIPLRETTKIHPHGLAGDLDIQVAILGYKTNILTSAGAELPDSPIPDPGEPFGDEDDEDYDYDDEGNFVVLGGGGGIKEDIALTLGTDPDIDSIWDEKLYKNLS